MPPAKKTTAAKSASAKPDDDGRAELAQQNAAELEKLRHENAQLKEAMADLNDEIEKSPDAKDLERLAEFIAKSYPTETRTDEGPVDVAVRLLDRSAAGPPAGFDPASGEPITTTGTAGLGAPTVDYTLSPDDVPNGATLADVADELEVDATTLLAYNAATLDAEAVARGLAHSDNGRIIFAGTVIKVPTKASRKG